MVRVAIQGDIGQQAYHVGDEAMVHAAVEQFARRGIDSVVLLTRDQAQTRQHFGAQVDVAPTLVFPWPPADRERYLGEIRSVVAGRADALPASDQVFGIIETLRGVDALFIAGGGNVNSRYGWLLHERAALAHIAARLGKPVVIGGQTLGPELSDTDRETLAELLTRASLVGLREADSLELALELVPDHPGLRAVLDDASDLPDPTPAVAPATRPTIAATFSPPEATPQPLAARAYARLLDVAAAHLGAEVSFLPHMAIPGTGDGDEAFHAQVAEQLSVPAELRPIASALETAARTRDAAAVVTSRYHPVVFACAAGKPAIAVAPDEYTQVRLAGALERFGRRSQVPTLEELVAVDSVPAEWLEPLSQPVRRPEPRLLAAQEQWWDDVVEALQAAPRGGPRRRRFGWWRRR